SKRKAPPTRQELFALVTTLRAEVTQLRQEKADLEAVLEMTTEHSDAVEEDLHDRAEEALRESERRLRMIVEATPVPVVICRLADGVIVYANAQAGPLLGLSTEALLGRHLTDFYSDPWVQQQLRATLERHGELDHHEVEFCTARGTSLWIEVSQRLLTFLDAPSVLSAWHNITHLRQMNQASSRFVPQEYLGFLQKETITEVGLGDYVTGLMPVIFSTLHNLTTFPSTTTHHE